MQDVDGLLAQARLDTSVFCGCDKHVVRRRYEFKNTPLLAKFPGENRILPCPLAPPTLPSKYVRLSHLSNWTINGRRRTMR
jgi:hypothetical protein